MVAQLVHEVEKLPADCLQEVMNFIKGLKLRRINNVSETMILSEISLAKDWDTPEEDEAWANL